MAKRITKVKFKDGLVEIHFEKIEGKSEELSILRSSDIPRPEFVKSFTELVEVVYEILELPEGWKEGGMKVTGVSFSMSETTAVEGAVITGQVELSTSNSPFCFNTPHLPFDQYSPTGEAPTMPMGAIATLETLRGEADLYVKGKRAQLELSGV